MKLGIYKYFKVGDVVKNETIWGKALFVIVKLYGNAYWPSAMVYFENRERINKNLCNFNIEDMKLVDAPKRPFRKLGIKSLIMLMNKGNIDAKREFLIRCRKN